MAGYSDPLYKVSTIEFHKKRDVKLPIPRNIDIWYDALENARVLNERSRTYVRVWLKSGMCYEGWMEGFQFEQLESQDRAFWLIGAKRWSTHEDRLADKPYELTNGVLLQSSQVLSIDIWWTDPPSST